MATATRKDHIAIAAELRNFLTEQRARKDALLSERAQLNASIEALYSAPLCRNDVLQSWFAYIDRLADDHLKDREIMDQFTRMTRAYEQNAMKKSPPLTLRNMEAIVTGADLHSTIGFDGWWFHGNSLSWNYFLFGDIIKKKLAENADRIFSGYEDGAAEKNGSVPERQKNIAALRAEIARIENDLIAVDALIEQTEVG